jgi:hypothetical protein
LAHIVPQIGRQFARIVQSFLHDEVDNKIALGNVEICSHEDANNGPSLQAWYKFAHPYDESWPALNKHFVLPDVPMPGNIKNFWSLRLRFACTPLQINKSDF